MDPFFIHQKPGQTSLEFRERTYYKAAYRTLNIKHFAIELMFNRRKIQVTTFLFLPLVALSYFCEKAFLNVPASE